MTISISAADSHILVMGQLGVALRTTTILKRKDKCFKSRATGRGRGVQGERPLRNKCLHMYFRREALMC